MKRLYYLAISLFFLLFANVSTHAQNCPLACNDLVIVSLNSNCSALVTPDMILEAPGAGCPYMVTIFDAAGQPIGDMVDGTYIGQTLEVRVFLGGNSCWGEIMVIDGQAPTVDCQPNVTASCSTLDPSSVPTFLVDDNCDPNPEIEILSDDINGQSCSSPFSATRTITYMAVDASGNESDVCTQTIQYERESLSAVDFPVNRDGLSLPAFQCNDPGWDGNGNGYPDPEEAGVPMIDGEPIYPQEVCDFWTYFNDQEIPICGGGFKVLRTWSVLDNCSGDIAEQIQVIKVEDNSTPTIHCPSDITVSGGYDCGAIVELPDPVIGSGCSGTPSYTVSVSGGIVSEVNGRFVVSGLDVGTYTVTYSVQNPCGGAPTSCQIHLTVTSGGGNGPIAICDQNTTVALGSDGTAKIFGSTFNDGSYSDCGDVVNIEVRRMTAGKCPPGVEDDTEFRDYVELCCADIPDNPVTIVLRVTDASGQTNECMVHVTVQNKLPPMIHCPPDVSVDCEYPLNINDLSDFGTVVTDPTNRHPIYVHNAHYPNGIVGYDGIASANCGHVTITEQVEDFTDCGGGYIRRTFTATDQGGSSASCIQRIYVKKDTPFSCSQINWPDDVEINSCHSVMTDPDNTGRPNFNNVGCGSIIATNYSDEVFSIVDGFCYKILRTWKVLDWCGTNGTHKICEHTQIIKVRDVDDPEFTAGCDDVTICTDNVQECSGFVNLSPTLDDCTPDEHLQYEYFIDAFNDNPGGKYDIVGTTRSIERFLPFGTHRVLWRVTDGCGNQSTCSYLVTVEDCKKPTPVCINGIATVVMPVNGMIQVEASLFNRSSFDNCTPNDQLQLSFSSDVTQTTRMFTCEDVGVNEVEIWVTDAAGNQEFCVTELSIQDNRETCPDTSSIVSGSLVTSSGFSVPQASVHLEHLDAPQDFTVESDFFGDFDFKMFDPPFMSGVKVWPTSDHNTCLGVTAYDLYLMQMHIFGLLPFDHSEQFVAADINKDERVNAYDLMELRDVLLRNKTHFENNHSWRFRDARFEPGLEDDPFDIEEEIILNSPSKLSEACDFIGIKVGDIDRSGRPGVELRSEEIVPIKITEITDRENDVSITASVEKKDQWVAYEVFWSDDVKINDIQISGISEMIMGNHTAIGHTSIQEGGSDKLQVKMLTSDIPGEKLLKRMQDGAIELIAYNAKGKRFIFRFVQESNAIDFQFRAFPNPFVDEITINWSSELGHPAQLELIDASGRMVSEKQVEMGESGQYLWRVGTQLSDGLYFLILRDIEGNVLGRQRLTRM
jgi:hypothetical protein